APVHVAVQVARDVPQLAELRQSTLQKDDLRRVRRNRRGSSERDRHVRLLEGDRVIDPIADEADLAAFLLETFDDFSLVGGQDLGKVTVHFQPLSQLARWRVVVAGDDRDVLDSPAAQTANNLEGLGTDGGPKLDRAAQSAVHADQNDGGPVPVSFLNRNLDGTRDGDLLQIHEPLAADVDRLPLDMDCDPVADLVPCLVVGRQIQPQLFG